jgi:hypothetical protein
MKLAGSILLSVSLLLALAIGAVRLGLFPEGTPLDYFSPQSTFVRKWEKELLNCHNIKTAEAMLKLNKEGGQVVTMKDGSWVSIVMEHSCCTGAGFNATLYITSAGGSYLETDSCYCSFSDLRDEIYGYSQESTATFLEAVRSNRKHLVARVSSPAGEGK